MRLRSRYVDARISVVESVDGVVAFVGGLMVSELVDPSEYDPLYLAGVLKFNECDYYECHEVWEELWTEYRGPAENSIKVSFGRLLPCATLAMAIYGCTKASWQRAWVS